MLVSEGHAGTRTILNRMAYADIRVLVMFRSELLLRPMSGSVALLQLGSVRMSVAHVSTGGHQKHAVLSC